MVVLAALIPILMLGVVLALGRYEELMLPEQKDDRREPAALPCRTREKSSVPVALTWELNSSLHGRK
ncbi:hypothetical protein [Streptomyces canus]|uniref:hypothetical protein n=1 Tax=Streptomyces canus TaxID=58343 RepID=UPI0030E0AD98